MSILSEDAKVDTPFHFKQAGVNPLRNQKVSQLELSELATPSSLRLSSSSLVLSSPTCPITVHHSHADPIRAVSDQHLLLTDPAPPV